MDVLALILACSLHPDDALVRTLVDVQSEGNVYFVGDLTVLKSRDGLTSAADALRVAEEIASHGGRPAVGLLGVPLDWAPRFGRAPRELFDACTNIAVGTAMLSEYQRTCDPPKEPPRAAAAALRRKRRSSRRGRTDVAIRTCILSHLAFDLGTQGEPAKILERLALTIDARGAAPAEGSAIFGEGVDDNQQLNAEWSDQRLYLDAGVGVKGVVVAASPAPPSRRLPAVLSPTLAPPSSSSLPWPRGPQLFRIVPGTLPPASEAAASPSQPAPPAFSR